MRNAFLSISMIAMVALPAQAMQVIVPPTVHVPVGPQVHRLLFDVDLALSKVNFQQLAPVMDRALMQLEMNLPKLEMQLASLPIHLDHALTADGHDAVDTLQTSSQ